MAVALVNGRVLLDEGFVEGKAVVIDGAMIADVVEVDAIPASLGRYDLEGGLLVPGFIDTQVNGGGGVLFNDSPTVETIRTIGEAHRRFGTTGFLPTLISDDLHVIRAGIEAADAAIAEGVPGVLGIHVEGPFLNHDRRGVHDAAKLRSLDAAAVELLATRHGGVTMVTLAPEMTTPELIRALDDAGVIVSAGHTDATYDELQPALASGLRGFTHLFNAMSGLGSREPGAVGAALACEESWCGLNVDGHHVHAETLKIALRAKRRDRFMLVTDAMPSVGSDTRIFQIQGRPITVVDTVNGDKIIDDEGRLAGAHLDMAAAVRNAVHMLGLDLTDALRMASAYPAAFLKLDHELGRIAPGHRANLVLLDDQLEVRQTWIDGRAA
jgi:N-acetylglucosamine-6-phosphate deacetylase